METLGNILILAGFGYTIFNLGQCYAISRCIREDNERHARLMATLRQS